MDKKESVTESDSTPHEQDTIRMLRQVLDDAWATLSPQLQTQANKAIIAQELLRLAANGERDPNRLCVLAVRSRLLVGDDEAVHARQDAALLTSGGDLRCSRLLRRG